MKIVIFTNLSLSIVVMIGTDITHISNFYVTGVNYKKSDASARGRFSVNEDNYRKILQAATRTGISDLLILSTCNRTEIYGFEKDADIIADLICTHTNGSKEEFSEKAYEKDGLDAIQHLFNVATGLDSQILGDYEITGQLRKAIKIAKEEGMVNTTFDRILNTALNTAKKIRTNTALSHGTVSVSFAAVHYIRQIFLNTRDLKILLVGLGKIGINTYKNITDYLPQAAITVVNRTMEKLDQLPNATNVVFKPISDLQECIAENDVVVVATNANEPVVTKYHLEKINSEKLLLDLSVPFNICPSVAGLKNISLINVDELSKINDITISKRQAEVPKAQTILASQMVELVQWNNMRKHLPMINQMRTTLEGHIGEMDRNSLDPTKCPYHALHNIVNEMMVKLKENPNHGCIYLQTMKRFITSDLN